MLKDRGAKPAEEKKRIGELLLEARVITEEQLQEALEEKKARGGRLCFNLIRVGALKADDLLLFLSEQFGVAAVNLDHFHVGRDIVELIPREFAVKENVVPLHLLDDTLTVAMVDPGRGEIVEKLREITGMKVDPLIAPEASLEGALEKYYGGGGDEVRAGEAEGVLRLGEEKEERHLYRSTPPREGYTAEDWLKRFFLQAIKRRSREIHLESTAKGLRARFRSGGRLGEGETAPAEMRRGIFDFGLSLAGIDSRSSSASPMEGKLKVVVRKRDLPVTLSSFPTIHGERLVFKIMEDVLIGRGLQELGMSKEVADEVGRVLNMRTGVFFVNAPPGQGRKTTFYSLLDSLREDEGRNIMTLEHPVQYPVANVSQTQVSFGQGVDFYHGLKSLLRQNPDVVGLSDISDCRTLELVFTAARQCLVIGLCSFWDNRQALEWIRNCGVSQTTQADLIRGLLVQRVLPRICSNCRENLDTPVELTEGVREKNAEDLVFYTGVGCEKCGQSGSSGRLGIFEFLNLRSSVRDLMARNTEVQIVYDEALRQGMWSLQEDGIMKATQGLVDVRDVLESTRDGGVEG
jgi:type IV pilus assembly protein PilB